MTDAEALATLSGWVGRSYADIDCWGLVREAYRLRGIELPATYQAAIAARLFRTVFEPEPFDVIPVSNHILGIATHAALYLGGGLVIHSLEETNVVIQPITREPLWSRIAREREGAHRRGYLRLRA